MERLKTAILISGRGTNMQALIEECAAPDAPAEIVFVLSNVPGAPGLERAKDAGLTTGVLDHREFGDRESFEDALSATLEGHGVEFICLAGFMRLLTNRFVDHWRDRLINIHPSLLPAYPGLDTHERAIADGIKFVGCTVHFVRVEMDAGPIIIQSAVPVLPDDTPETLAARVLAEEHKCFPFALRQAAMGNIRIVNEKVIVDGAEPPPGAVANPDTRH